MAKLPDSKLPWAIPWEGVVLIAEQEGCRLSAYRNFPREPWTCGWGETEGVGPNTKWTQQFADHRFCDSIGERTDAVLAACTVVPNPNQLAGMVSLAYNIGLGWDGRVKPKGAKDGFRQSSVLRRHNEGNFAAAARAFSMWNKIDKGKGPEPDPVLTARRLAEASLYSKPIAEGEEEPRVMPQVVEPEKTLAQSTNVRSGITLGTIGALSALKDTFAPLKDAADAIKEFFINTLGFGAESFLPLCMVIAGAIIIRERFRNKKEGSS